VDLKSIESKDSRTISDNIISEGVNQTSIILGSDGGDVIRSFDSYHTIIVTYLARLSLSVRSSQWRLHSIEPTDRVYTRSTARNHSDEVVVHMSGLNVAHDVIILLDNSHDNVACNGHMSAIICTDLCQCKSLYICFAAPYQYGFPKEGDMGCC
jgi:hypothetical protein